MSAPNRSYMKPEPKDNPWFSNMVAKAAVTVGTEATNVIRVSIQLQRPENYNDLAEPGSVEMYLSDNADGSSIAASAPTGGWAIGVDGLLLPIIANKYARFVSESDGDIDIDITESSAKTFYLVIILPSGDLIITPVTFA